LSCGIVELILTNAALPEATIASILQNDYRPARTPRHFPHHDVKGRRSRRGGHDLDSGHEGALRRWNGERADAVWMRDVFDVDLWQNLMVGNNATDFVVLRKR